MRGISASTDAMTENARLHARRIFAIVVNLAIKFDHGKCASISYSKTTALILGC